MIHSTVFALLMWGRVDPKYSKYGHEGLAEIKLQKPIERTHPSNLVIRLDQSFNIEESIKGLQYWRNIFMNNINNAYGFEYDIIEYVNEVDGIKANSKVPFKFMGQDCTIHVAHFMKIRGHNCIYGNIRVNGKSVERSTAIPIKSLNNYQHDNEYKGSNNPKPRFNPTA